MDHRTTEGTAWVLKDRCQQYRTRTQAGVYSHIENLADPCIRCFETKAEAKMFSHPGEKPVKVRIVSTVSVGEA